MATAKATQKGRLLAVKVQGLDDDKLLAATMSASEGISQLFRYQLELFSDDDNVKGEDLIGKTASVKIALQKGERYFHGVISRFAAGGRDLRFRRYQMELVPWLWMLTRTSDCLIFQQKSVPEVIKAVFAEYGFKDFKESYTGSYTKYDYLVQYRETDFNFVSRLLEDEGIYYYFTHEKDKHTLVLADAPGGHVKCSGQAQAIYLPVAGTGEKEEDRVTNWQVVQTLHPGKYTLTDYHFQKPASNLASPESSKKTVGGNNKYEIYDFPGEYALRFNKPDASMEDVQKEGKRLVKLRMEEAEAAHQIIQGTSGCRAFSSGTQFELSDYPTKGVKGSYVLTTLRFTVTQAPDYYSESLAEEPYHNSFSCIPLAVPFRPQRLDAETGRPGPADGHGRRAQGEGDRPR